MECGFLMSVVRNTRFIQNSVVVGDDEVVIVMNPNCEIVIAANKLAYRGMRLIDDEIYSLHSH